jgi:aryl-alcohol dehydrogenase-like predicted oxidoreductase
LIPPSHPYTPPLNNNAIAAAQAEVYGFGLSEEFLGEFMRANPTTPPPLVATKYAPQPWRYTADSVVAACRASLARLRLEQMALYIQHWPGFALNAFSNDAYLEGLARCAEQGLTRAVGVSNFNAKRVRGAARALEARGTVLSSNQVQYSLLYRAPETNGGARRAFLVFVCILSAFYV